MINPPMGFVDNFSHYASNFSSNFFSLREKLLQVACKILAL
jgi:hypothetical protein